VSPADYRGQARFLTELDLVIMDAGGGVLDHHAQALDITPAGFRAETRIELKKGQTLDFELLLEGGERVRGRARVVWVTPDGRGCSAGAKITRLSWKDRGKLRRQVAGPSYDFGALARKTFWAAYWIVIAVAAHNIINHQPLTRMLIFKLTPIALALAVAGWAMLELLG